MSELESARRIANQLQGHGRTNLVGEAITHLANAIEELAASTLSKGPCPAIDPGGPGWVGAGDLLTARIRELGGDDDGTSAQS